jgi:hypothetical protein
VSLEERTLKSSISFLCKIFTCLSLSLIETICEGNCEVLVLFGLCFDSWLLWAKAYPVTEN